MQKFTITKATFKIKMEKVQPTEREAILAATVQTCEQTRALYKANYGDTPELYAKLRDLASVENSLIQTIEALYA
jgi:methylphosphotriester-DNA--protein-cysteine methyltransferase